MFGNTRNLDGIFDENQSDVTKEINTIWSISNKLRGSYMPDKYCDVIIPMTIIRRLECVLEQDNNRNKELQFYNTSNLDLAMLCKNTDNIASNFKTYILGFSTNVQTILRELEIEKHIDKMNKDGCLYQIIKAFSELDLTPETYDSIKMGYIFEYLIGKIFHNVHCGQYYTGRDIIKTCISLLLAEGCEDIFEDGKVIRVCDQACGTGGMLTIAYNYLKQCNPTAEIKLYGQEIMGVSYAIGLAEMLIKGLDICNFKNVDTLKEDCFKKIKMRFVMENPPFGTSWAGCDAKRGQEEAVKKEYQKSLKGRWGMGLPNGSDSQLLFMQSAIDKMDDKLGRSAIITNSSPLFTGNISSGESQIRRYLLENDLIEAIIQLPIDLFYNTGIITYLWILSKNKKAKRKGKIQLIDVSSVYHRLKKPLGNKKNEITQEDRIKITKLYTNFEENEYSKIFKNTEFIYREYTIIQPLQRSYAITQDRIDNIIKTGVLKGIYDEKKVYELEHKLKLSERDKKKLEKFYQKKPTYEAIMKALRDNASEKLYMNKESFESIITKITKEFLSNNEIEKLIKGLSRIDKDADIEKDNEGNIIYDEETKEIERVPYNVTIEDYMKKEVLPYIPNAKAVIEDDMQIKAGARIPFTQYFYKYYKPIPSVELKQKFLELEASLNEKIGKLFDYGR